MDQTPIEIIDLILKFQIQKLHDELPLDEPLIFNQNKKECTLSKPMYKIIRKYRWFLNAILLVSKSLECILYNVIKNWSPLRRFLIIILLNARGFYGLLKKLLHQPELNPSMLIKKIMEEKELPVKKALIRKQRNHFFVGEPLIFRIGIQYNTKSNVQNTAKILVLLLSKKWDQCMILLIQKLELSFDQKIQLLLFVVSITQPNSEFFSSLVKLFTSFEPRHINTIFLKTLIESMAFESDSFHSNHVLIVYRELLVNASRNGIQSTKIYCLMHYAKEYYLISVLYDRHNQKNIPQINQLIIIINYMRTSIDFNVSKKLLMQNEPMFYEYPPKFFDTCFNKFPNIILDMMLCYRSILAIPYRIEIFSHDELKFIAEKLYVIEKLDVDEYELISMFVEKILLSNNFNFTKDIIQSFVNSTYFDKKMDIRVLSAIIIYLERFHPFSECIDVTMVLHYGILYNLIHNELIKRIVSNIRFNTQYNKELYQRLYTILQDSDRYLIDNMRNRCIDNTKHKLRHNTPAQKKLRLI